MNVQCRHNLQPRMIGEIRSEGEKLPLYHSDRMNKLSFCIDSGSPTVGSGEYWDLLGIHWIGVVADSSDSTPLLQSQRVMRHHISPVELTDLRATSHRCRPIRSPLNGQPPNDSQFFQLRDVVSRLIV